MRILSPFVVLLLVGSALPIGLAVAGDSFAPDRHFSIVDPAGLDPGAAERAYGQVKADMAARFAVSREPAAKSYQRWWRVNRSPHLSATHGSRYVNNYVNRPAWAYGTLAPGAAMPVSSIIAKDAVSVDSAGRVLPGELALMEKMPPGYDAAARDWRYALILPDGSVFADSSGANPGGVEEVGRMPTGAVLAKYSFVAHPDGGLEVGPVFLMERLEDGASQETAGWLYTTVMPSGAVDRCSPPTPGGSRSPTSCRSGAASAPAPTTM